MEEISFLKYNINECEVLIANPSKINFLNNFRGILINGTILVSSDFLDSEAKYQELLELVHAIYKLNEKKTEEPFRFNSMQLCSLIGEWDIIQKQHLILLKIIKNQPMVFETAHFCLPTEFAGVDQEKLLNKKRISQLLKQFNAEAGLMYCRWFNQECLKMLSTFRAEDSEEYQLQGLLENFSHEVNSYLLINHCKAISQAIIEEENAITTKDHQKVLALEKQIISAQMHLLSNLQEQNNLLSLIVDGIQQIETPHPELTLLKSQAMLLNQAISNFFSIGNNGWAWKKYVLIMQLLDEQLKVIPLLNWGMASNRIADEILSMQLALAQMKSRFSFKELLKMCLEWDFKTEGKSAIHQVFHQYMQSNLRNLNVFKKEI